MHNGKVTIASTELETVLKRKSRMKTHFDRFRMHPFPQFESKTTSWIFVKLNAPSATRPGEISAAAFASSFPPESGRALRLIPIRSYRSLPRLLKITSHTHSLHNIKTIMKFTSFSLMKSKYFCLISYLRECPVGKHLRKWTTFVSQL